MICLRVRYWPQDAWTQIAFSGEEEETAFGCLAATLTRQEWEVEISRDGGEWFELGEEEPT